MKYVTEQMKPQDEWFKRAEQIKSISALNSFAKELLKETSHDYGTICHAIGALALGAAWLGSNMHGITGFQAGFVMWDFIRQWEYRSNECGLKIVDYDNMLYPQYEQNFDKTISKKQFGLIQEKAKKLLSEWNDAHPAVIRHWQSIAEGEVPFGYQLVDENE